MLNGVSSATFFILPMLGKHPDEYPRFRDCFVSDPEHKEHDNKIHVYTRVGGGNREYYDDEIEELRAMPGYVGDFDDSFDCTYATFIFDVPEKFKKDFTLIVEGKVHDTSEDYRSTLYKVYPKLKEQFDNIFSAPLQTH